MKSRGVMQHSMANVDRIYNGGDALLQHEKSPIQPQSRIVSAGHGIEAYPAMPTNVQPQYVPFKHRRKRRTKPMPEFPKHRWSL